MERTLLCKLFLVLFSIWAEAVTDVCLVKQFLPTIPGKALEGHVLKNITVEREGSCEIHCYREHNCQSYNVIPLLPAEGWLCQLNNADEQQHPGSLKSKTGYKYRATKNPCSSSPCSQNATCQPSFIGDDKFQCICPTGFTGKYCENDLNECEVNTHNCSLHATCVNRIGSFNCSCKLGFDGDGHNCTARKGYWYTNLSMSCEEVLSHTPESLSGPYYLVTEGGGMQQAYCHMTTIPGCSGAGWTLAMKISGNEATFLYSSEYWTNKQPFNLQGGLSGLDEVETKLPSYWSTSFTTLCVGMKVNGVTNWLMINHAAPSLYSLLANGGYTQLNMGRSAWKSLIDDSSLQVNCEMEGFNVSPQSYYSDPAVARIGIIANGENDCFSCDSRIGFGTGGSLAGQDGTNSCGNEVKHSPDNGVRHTKAHCYIFVK